MHAFERVAALAAMAAIVSLSGCQAPVGSETNVRAAGMPPGHADGSPNEDGRLCGMSPSGDVFILVGYDASGTPVVSPDRCHVAPGTTITWRGPDNDRRAFEIVFKAASASDRGQQRIPSEAAPDRRKARIVAKGLTR